MHINIYTMTRCVCVCVCVWVHVLCVQVGFMLQLDAMYSFPVCSPEGWRIRWLVWDYREVNPLVRLTTLAHTPSLTHTSSFTHTHARTHARTHTHTHTHTHQNILFSFPSFISTPCSITLSSELRGLVGLWCCKSVCARVLRLPKCVCFHIRADVHARWCSHLLAEFLHITVCVSFPPESADSGQTQAQLVLITMLIDRKQKGLN